MTSEALKTNEFLRRRKLRLQQVREQSKDIAKKIRQRAQVEKLKQFDDLDEERRKDYLQKQGQLITKLEELYAKGVESIGASHKSASELKEQDHKIDLSKKRGKEAAAELRRKRQEKLDEQKKLLDKRLQAREAANEISREKSAVLTNKTKGNVVKETQDKASTELTTNKDDVNIEKLAVVLNDMATQWDFNEIPNEWEPSVPALSLPKDDRDSLKETNCNVESKSDKSKRIDLFALSEEMPSSLRGGLTNDERIPIKPSLTLITEYLQSRGMRLRETGSGSSNKNEELQSLKQTIQRTRTSKEVSEKSTNIEKSIKSTNPGSAVAKKNSVTQYNHSTRDTRNLPYGADKFVVRDSRDSEDAYSQAMKESSLSIEKENDHSMKLQDIRNKVAMTKQSVEKEYKDTISFLNSLPKDKPSKRITNAYMDEHRQQMKEENRQRKLRDEYRKVEKECRKHSCTKKSHSKPRSPAKVSTDFNSQDFQYSWMPVPESDASLAIHTVPTNVRQTKSGNMVKFSTVDSYHEYRSRHKHTPPTKDIGSQEKRDKRIEAVIIQNNSDSIDSSRSSTSEASVENIAFASDKQKTHDPNLSDAERIIIYKILDSKSDKRSKKAKLVKDVAPSLTSIEKDKGNKNNKEKRSPSKKSKNNDVTPFEEIKEGVYKTVSEKGDNVTSMYFSDKPNCEADIVLTEEELKYGRPCCCRKKLREAEPSDKGTFSQWENGDTNSRKACNSAICGSCKCGLASTSKVENGSSNQPSVIPPSAATSTSSFKTATNNKANNALPEGGYIKLVDEGGQETGKFYIGASGFLKDDAYEVVIQLRKKDGNKEEKVVDEKEVVLDKLPNTKHAEVITEANSAVAAEVQITPVDESKTDVRSQVNEQVSKEQNNVEELLEQIMNEPNGEPTNSDPNVNVISEESGHDGKYVDKEVLTSSQISCIIPNSVHKSDSMPRPATSTYTQTSLSSPNHRPIFFHMSSSTSTAYMSPPEMVLPNFLRPNYRITDEEIYEAIQNCDSKDKFELDEREYIEEYDGCKCKRCLHARKVTLCKESLKNNHDTSRFQTPPNTARSCTKNIKGHNRNVPNKIDCRCRKCKSNSQLNMSTKNKKHLTCTKKSSRHTVHPTSSAATSYRTKTNPSSCDVKRLGLNPVIKKYVDKLLALNKEGLKAVEVAEQDCSSVATPGSSIIQVSTNINENKPQLEEKISIEQIKNMLKKQILEEIAKESKNDQNQPIDGKSTKPVDNKSIQVPRLPLKKSVHKVKSLNIPKQLKLKNQVTKKQSTKVNSTSVSSKTTLEKPLVTNISPIKNRSKSSPTPRNNDNFNLNRKVVSDIETERSTNDNKVSNTNLLKPSIVQCETDVQKPCHKVSSCMVPTNRATTTESSNFGRSQKSQNEEYASTNPIIKINENTDSDTNLIRIAEDKLQNMEKIADLTEKCTIRLSNLAKILEEVRKNKSLVYGHISSSDSASDSDRRSEKNDADNKMPLNTHVFDPKIDTDQYENKSPISISTIERDASLCTTDYVPLLTNIPKPASFVLTNFTENLSPLSSVHIDNASVKNRGRPPPALSRIHLKNGHEIVVPHELSTVLEVDSPLSVKLKNQSSRDKNSESAKANESYLNVNGNVSNRSNLSENSNKDTNANPDLLPSGSNLPKPRARLSISDSSDDSKLQMIELKEFNDIMLKPFISFKEHAKQCNIVGIEEGSNIDDNPKDDGVNDDISSLHSDGSLPDVIAELLKRKIITEPFKYDTASNLNSTTISSESTLSVLALSKMRKKKKSNIPINNKENIVESSDTLSMSSNPDLEKTFKKLGLGWASSTLKKTKERLALSSSSNTSSSSLSQFKLKGFENFEIPALVTDSLSTVLDITKKPARARHVTELSKNAEQQTSKTNAMTVKDFLKNELAKKITFTSQSHREDTDEEFVSLAETKMPEQIKNVVQTIQEEGTFDSVPSVKENRARTSTPVQLFKSGTYQSSSSSNNSNGLFSNADDLSSVKVTSNSIKNHSTSEKDDLAVPNFNLKKKKSLSDCSKSD